MEEKIIRSAILAYGSNKSFHLSLEELISMMVEADLKRVRAEQ